MGKTLNEINAVMARGQTVKQTNGYPQGGASFDWTKKVYAFANKRGRR